MTQKQSKPKDNQFKIGKKQINQHFENLYRQLAIQQQKLKKKAYDSIRLKHQRYQKSIKPRITQSQSQQNIPIDGDIIQGSRVFTKQCSSCHTMDPNSAGRNSTGPALGLIFNRIAGSDAYFNGYTKALLKSQVYWNNTTLYHYLQNPSKYIPGSKCNFMSGGLKSKQQRIDVIKFLKSFTKQLSINIRGRAQKLHGKDYVQTQLKVSKQATNRRNQN